MRERSDRPKKNQPAKKLDKRPAAKNKPAANKKANKKTVPKKSTVKEVASKKTVKKTSTKKVVKKAVLKEKRLDPQDLDFKYLGSSDKWLIIELVEECDLKEDAESVVRQLKEISDSSVVYFLPMYTEYVKDKSIRIVLFDGYIFVKMDDIVDESCFKGHTKHISGPLLCNGKNQYVKNKDINGFKRELKKRLKMRVPKNNQIVVPKVGDYKNLEGVVLSVDKKNMVATVEFALASRVVEVGIRIINLEIME